MSILRTLPVLLCLGALSCSESITGPRPVTEGPLTLHSVSLTPSQISLGSHLDLLEIRVHASSQAADIGVVQIGIGKRGDPDFAWTFGGGLNLESGTRRDGIWNFRVRRESGGLQIFSEPATYFLRYVEIRDEGGNSLNVADAELREAGHDNELEVTP